MTAIPSGAIWIRVPRFFGDAVMIHDAIAPLREAKLPLVMWGPAFVVDLFDGSEDYQATVAEPGRKYSPLQAARMLREHRPAALISFPKSLRPHAAGFLARVPLRLGCAGGGGWLLCTHSVDFWRMDQPLVERYAIGVRKAFPQLPPTVPFRPFRPRPAMLEACASARAGLGLERHGIFALGANSWSKRPSPGAFATLGKALLDQGIRPVLLGAGAEEQGIARGLVEALPGCVDLVGQCNLALSAAWVSCAEVVVGGDSGLSHLGAACGVPVLGVFGPTRPRHSAPWGPKVAVVVKDGLDCLECMRGDCPVAGHPCMNAIPEAALLDGLRTAMGS